MAPGLGETINKLLDLCRAHPDGLPQRVLDEEIPDLEMLSQALNFLLSKIMYVGAAKVGSVYAGRQYCI